ncbi:cadherin domain-containing protein [Marinoscillum luteum]|uniref:Cadherin domain-containing protein n=1 Tax=Marinoscillum luteum TaxID=861051 RepID=A0ABW7NDN2_9BACT
MRKLFALVLFFLLTHWSWAQTTYTVTNTNDDGAGSLREAMTLAEGSSGADIIDMTGITGTITLASALPDITQDLTINGSGSSDLAIDGAGTYRIFFIVNETAPTVVINDLTLQNGLAKGQDKNYAGAGAGMGGAIYADNATLSLENVIFDGNTAQGGNGGVAGGTHSGGAGPFDTGGAPGSSGPNGNPGGTGGFGSGGGVGGAATVYGGGANGRGGTGGYGAGAGAPGVANFQAPGTSPGGTGGMFGGSTNSFNGSSSSSARSGGGGGGLGGALFVRAGSAEFTNVTFSNNQASKGLGGAYSGDGQGKGGALFLMDGVTAEGVGVSFSNNTASNAGETDSDNNNNYGTLSIITNIVIESNPEDDEISEGEDVIFSVAVTGSGATYQWQVNDGSTWSDLEDDDQISGSDTEELSLTCLDINWDQYQFRCVVEGTLNTETSEVATLTVNPTAALEVTITGQDFILCGAQEITFTAVAENVETTPEYQWVVNGEEVPDETGEDFSYEVSAGDEISVILSESGTCYTRAAATSEIITIVESDTIAVTTDASSGQGSFAWAVALANTAACDQTITVDLTGLPDNSTINISGILITASRLKIVGPGRDLLRFEDTTPSSYSLSSQGMEYLEMSGFELYHDQGNTSDGLRLESSMTILSEIAVSGYTQNGISTVSMDNDFDQLFLSDNSKGILFYSSQLGAQTSSEVPASVSLTNSEFDNNETSVFINDFQSFTTSTIENVVIKNNQDQYDGGLQINLYNSSGSFTTTHYITNVSFINAYASGVNLKASDGNDQIIAHFTNCTFSGNGIRSYDDNLDSETTYISALANKNSEVILTNCTFAQNAIAISYDEVSGGSALATIKNSIFVGNTISNVYTSTGEATVTESNNIGYPTFSGVASDVINTTLTDPSGTGLLVHELVVCTSSALDAGDDSVAPETDQLGNTRSGISDLGAVESQGFINTQPQDLKDFLGNEASFSVVASADTPTYQWQVSSGGEYTDLADDATYSGTQTSELTIAELSDDLDGNSYRVVINGLCENISSGALLDVIHYPTSEDGSIITQEDATYSFQESDIAFADSDEDLFAGIQIISDVSLGYLLYDGDAVSTDVTYSDLTLLTFTPEANANGEGYATFTFKVADDSGEDVLSTLTYTMTIDVSPVGDAPTDISLSKSDIDEDAAVGSAIGTLTTTDVDADDTFSYEVLTSIEIGGQTIFPIVANGDQLVTTVPLDFEQVPQYLIEVEVTDGYDLTFTKSFLLSTNDVNEAPTNLALSVSTVDENTTVGDKVGDFSSDDQDTGAAEATFSLKDGATDNAAFTITDNALYVAEVFDFETRSSYEVTVLANDGNGGETEGVFTITVNDLNEAPTAITLSVAAIDENEASGTLIGVLSAADADAGDSHTFSLASGVDDNDSFTVSGSDLSAAESFDFETKDTYTITVTATDAGGLTYDESLMISISDVFEKLDQVITFDVLPAKAFGDADFTLTGSSSSGLALTYASSDPAIAKVSGTTVSILKVGSVTITASQAGDDTYNPATDVSQTLTIGKASQSITFGALEDKAFGDADFDLTATASSGLSVSYASSDESIATIAGATVTIHAAGTVEITASHGGDDNYAAAGSVTQTLTIGKASQSITFSTLEDKTFGDAAFDLTATASSGLSVTYVSSDESIATIAGATVTIHAAGTVEITASQAGDDNYTAAGSVAQSLTIGKASQSITFGALEDKTFGDAAFDLTATASSGLSVSYVSSDESIATIAGATVTIHATGTVEITASQTGDDNYAAAGSVAQSLTIGKASQSITFGALEDKTFGDAAFDLTATASSGLSISYVSSDPAVASVSGSTITIHAAGSATISATQSGDGNFLAATDVQQVLTVNKASQSIAFEDVDDIPVGSAPVALRATASSGLEVTYTVTGPVTLSGNSITATGAGLVTVTANQDGNENYLAATPVVVSFEVLAGQSVVLSVLQEELTIYPNPFTDRFTLDVTSPYQGEVHLSLSDLSGRVVFSARYEKSAGRLVMEENVVLAPGIYTMILTVGNERVLRRVIKE